MNTLVEHRDAQTSTRQVAELLGVIKRFKHGLSSTLSVHELLRAGLPRRALLKAIERVSIPVAELLPVFGISTRTFMRLKAEPDKLLDAECSGRVWQFAQMLVKAEDIFGTNERAARWLLNPAMALENQRPIDLLTTPIGTQLVDDVIERIRHGVYQ